MNKLISLIIILVAAVSFSQAQNVAVTYGNYTNITLAVTSSVSSTGQVIAQSTTGGNYYLGLKLYDLTADQSLIVYDAKTYSEATLNNKILDTISVTSASGSGYTYSPNIPIKVNSGILIKQTTNVLNGKVILYWRKY